MTEIENKIDATEIQDVNEVNLTGRILSIYSSTVPGPHSRIPFARLTLSTRTLPRFYRKDQPTSEVRDNPTIYWYGRKAEDVANNFKNGDIVTIQAYAKLMKVNNKVDNTSKYFQDLIGQSIETTLKQLDEGFGLQTNLGQYCNDENEVRLSGTILRRYSPNNYITILTLESRVDGHRSLVEVNCTNKNNNVVKKIADGAHVCLMGKVETSTYTQDDKKRTRQRIVCYNIAEA